MILTFFSYRGLTPTAIYMSPLRGLVSEYSVVLRSVFYLKLHSSILRLALFGGVVGDGLVGAVAFGDDVGGGAAEGDKVVFH